MNRLASSAFLAGLLFVCPALVSAQTALPDPRDVPPASGQDAMADPPAHVSRVDGVASLSRDGHPDPAPVSMPLLAGDRLRTEHGRVEVIFGDGATLHLDESSTVDFQSDEVLRCTRRPRAADDSRAITPCLLPHRRRRRLRPDHTAWRVPGVAQGQPFR